MTELEISFAFSVHVKRGFSVFSILSQIFGLKYNTFHALMSRKFFWKQVLMII